MSGLQKKVTNFFGTGSPESTKSRANAAPQVAASCPKKPSGSAAPRPPNAHAKSRSKTKNGSGVGTSKSRQGSSRSGRARVVEVHHPSSQSKSSKKGPHSQSKSQKRDVSKSVLFKPRGSGSKSPSHFKQRNPRTKKLENSPFRVRRSNLTAIGVSPQQKQLNDVRTSDDAERGAGGKLTSSGRYQKLVMCCTKLGVFVTMLGQLGFIIYIFVINILRDEIPTSTGLMLSLTHLMIIFLSLEVIFYATKTLCLFTCLADLLAILASFIYIAIRESSNNYLEENVTAAQNAMVLHQAVFATAESCVLLMFNLCMVLTLYTEIRSTSSTEIGVVVMSMNLEGADQKRERSAVLEKASLTQKVGACEPFLQMIRRKKADPKGASGGGHMKPLETQGKIATLAPMKASQQTPQRATIDRSSAFSTSGKSSASTAPPPQPTPVKEIPATAPASVLPGSEKSTTSQKPSPPKLTLLATSSSRKPFLEPKQTFEKPRILAQNIPTAVSLDMAVPPQTAVSVMTTARGPLGFVQTAKLANETPEVVTVVPQQATNTPEKPIASTITSNVTGTSIAQNMATPTADPSRVAANSARPPSSTSGATPMRYFCEEKQKANQ